MQIPPGMFGRGRERAARVAYLTWWGCERHSTCSARAVQARVGRELERAPMRYAWGCSSGDYVEEGVGRRQERSRNSYVLPSCN